MRGTRWGHLDLWCHLESLSPLVPPHIVYVPPAREVDDAAYPPVGGHAREVAPVQSMRLRHPVWPFGHREALHLHTQGHRVSGAEISVKGCAQQGKERTSWEGVDLVGGFRTT